MNACFYKKMLIFCHAKLPELKMQLKMQFLQLFVVFCQNKQVYLSFCEQQQQGDTTVSQLENV